MANAKLNDKQKTFSLPQQLSSLLILLLVGVVISYLIPKIPSSSLPALHKSGSITPQDIVTLLLLSAITIIFLSYYRGKAYFSSKWLIAATTYNLLILLVKFTLASNEINKSSSSVWTITYTAFVVSCLYIFGLFVLFLIFEGKLISKKMHKRLITTNDGKVLLSLYMFLFITIVRIVVYHLPNLKNTVAASYLGDIFKPRTFILSALILIITFSVVQAYGQVRRKQDLVGFFISATGLLFCFHLWWAVYIYRVVG